MMRSVSIYCLLLVFGLTTSVEAQLVINEFVSSNSGGLSDPLYDDTGDWIELHNASSQSMNLEGYYLTDNLGQFDKWQFPRGSIIGAGGYLIVWADGADTGLHTSYKLTKNAEEIGLFDPDGMLLDSIIYASQRTDVSYGRRSSGEDDWGYYEQPTPGSENTTKAYSGIVFYRPSFSIKGGFYQGGIEVEITAIGGEIHYTLDGALPTLDSPIYSDPLTLDQTTPLRARVFIDDSIPGLAGTQTYFINEDLESTELPIVSITTDNDYFWDEEIGLYMQDFKPLWEYPINIELFENDGGNRAAFNQLAGVRVNGLNSWVLPQKMLGIYFDNEYDNSSIEYPIFEDRRRTKYDNFTLRVSGSDWSATMMRDGLTQGLIRGRMNLSSMGYRPSIVFVNGEFLGVHNLRSRIDEAFIENNYGYEGSEYDLIENDGDVEQGSDEAFNALMALLDRDMSEPGNYEAVKEVMDIENYIDFYTTVIWSSNSSYGHNIQLWKPKAEGSKWLWMAQDFDRGFYGADDGLIESYSTDPPHYHWVADRLANLLTNQEFADLFLRRFADHLYTTFHPDRVIDQINDKASAIEGVMPRQIEKWQGTTSSYGNAIPSMTFWRNQVYNMKLFARERQDEMFADLIRNFKIDHTANLGVSADDAMGGTQYLNDMSIPADNWTSPYLADYPFSLTAVPSPGYDFVGWSKKEYAAAIPKESTWKYTDHGEAPGLGWQAIDFDDAHWQMGQAQLGYGDDDENTLIDFGGDTDNKHITSYYRKQFSIDDIEQISGDLVVNLLRDDGAVIYLNGVEVVRSNMPDGPIDNETQALAITQGSDENSFFTYLVTSEALVQGPNVIAVEVHQNIATSSDVSFDMELLIQASSSEVFSTEPSISVELNGDSQYTAHYLPSTQCILPETLTADMTLSIDCSPYLVRKTVTVAPNVTLTVDPGVDILFPDNEGLRINGDLQVNGTEAQPVRFLPNTDYGATIWSNIYFENATDTSSLVWLEMVGSSRGKHPLKENAAISAWNSSIKIDHLTLEETYQNPILGRYSDLWLENSKLYSAVTGDLINVKYGYGYIDGCEFRGNDQVDTDAIDYDEVVNGVIRNSKISNFRGFNSDGIDLGEESKDILVENNFIHHVTDKGISIGQKSTLQVLNNTIVECNLGIGIKDQGIATIDQNTFYNNGYDIAAFEKNAGIGGGHVHVSNSILSNSVFAPLLVDTFSTSVIGYTLSDTDSLTIGESNVYGDPLFVNPDQANFNLMDESDAINLGLDEGGEVINLGTKSHQYSTVGSLVISAIEYHEKENNAREFVRIYNPTNQAIDASGYQITAGIQFVFDEGTTIAPQESIHVVKDWLTYSGLDGQVYEWTSGSLSNDGEQIILRDQYGIVIDHVTYSSQLPWPQSTSLGSAYLELVDTSLDNHFAKNWRALPTFVLPTQVSDEVKIFTLAPNPANDIVTIQSMGSRIKRATLYNAYGKQIMDLVVDQTSTEIALSGLPNGIYFILINQRETHKLIKG